MEVRLRKGALLAAMLGGGCVVPAWSQETPPVVDGPAPYREAREKIRQRLAPAEFPSLADATFVKLVGYDAASPESSAQDQRHCWLISETPDRLNLLFNMWGMGSRAKDPARNGEAEGVPEAPTAKAGRGGNGPWRVCYVKLDFAAHVRQRLAREPEGRDAGTAQAYLWLCWACDQRGLDELAAECYRKACTRWKLDEGVWGVTEPAADGVNLLDRWVERTAIALRVELFEAYSEDLGRPAAATMAKRVAALLKPGGPGHREMTTLARHWRAMAAEDQARAKAVAPALSDLTGDARITELIFRLRDVRARQLSQPGRCYVLDRWSREQADEDPEHPHPAFALSESGKAAVPHLIELITDTRPLRSHGYWRMHAPTSYHLLRYCDAADQILQRITGQVFHGHERTTSQYLGMDGDLPEVQAAWRSWWAGARERTAHEWLLEELESPATERWKRNNLLRQLLTDPAFTQHARVEKHLRALMAQGDAGQVPGLVRTAPDAMRRKYLGELLAHPRLAVAFQAGRVAAEAGDADLAAKLMPRITKTLAEPAVRWGLGEYVVGSLLQFLKEQGTEASTALMVRLLDAGDSTVRKEVLEALPGLESPELEEVAVRLLSDRVTRYSWWGGLISKPRLCDYAAVALARRLGVYEDHNWEVADSDRDRIVREVHNLWRKERGLEPLPVITRPEPLPAATVQPHLPSLISLDPATRAKAIRSLIELGPRAVLNLAQFEEVQRSPGNRRRVREARFAIVKRLQAVTVAVAAPAQGEDRWRAALPGAPADLDPRAIADAVRTLWETREEYRELKIVLEHVPGRGLHLSLRVAGPPLPDATSIDFESSYASGGGMLDGFADGDVKGFLAEVLGELEEDPGKSFTWSLSARKE